SASMPAARGSDPSHSRASRKQQARGAHQDGQVGDSARSKAMSDGIWSATSGAIGQVTALDVAAENVANASTPGFHGNRAGFGEVLTHAVHKRAGGFDLKYAVAATPAADLTPGATVVTGRPLDVAIRGEGYLVVKTAQGERYTRSGSLRIDSQGAVLTAGGDP